MSYASVTGNVVQEIIANSAALSAGEKIIVKAAFATGVAQESITRQSKLPTDASNVDYRLVIADASFPVIGGKVTELFLQALASRIGLGANSKFIIQVASGTGAAYYYNTVQEEVGEFVISAANDINWMLDNLLGLNVTKAIDPDTGDAIYFKLGSNETQNVSIQSNSTIDGAIGYGGDDTIEGNAQDNALFGNAGSDQLEGFAGKDTLIGGDGVSDIDIVSYEYADARVEVNLENGTASVSSADQDILRGIEGVIGTRFNDSVIGSSGAEYFYTGDGVDSDLLPIN